MLTQINAACRGGEGGRGDDGLIIGVCRSSPSSLESRDACGNGNAALSAEGPFSEPSGDLTCLGSYSSCSRGNAVIPDVPPEIGVGNGGVGSLTLPSD